jgi:protein TonB
MYWGPNLRQKVEQMSVAGKKLTPSEKITGVNVLLNKQGRIVKVDVINRSGVKEVDEAAVEAFNRAGPFPNPPVGLVEQDGLIRVRWDFVLNPA